MSLSQEDTKNVAVQIINAFVKDGTGGNPAGVVLNADRFNDDDMLKIAQQVGLSETAFVSESKTEGVKLDFFTPTRRIAHCGHATVATFSYLASAGLISDGETSKETIDGPRKIIVNEGAAYMEQLAPSYREAAQWQDQGVDKQKVLDSLGLSQDDLDPRLDPILVNTGNSFIVIAVRDQAALRNIRPDFEAITDISDRLDLIGYYVFTTDGVNAPIDATTRMFAPRYGIEEEAATGMAAGPLACVLFDLLKLNKETLVIEQGQFMTPASPSEITVKLDFEGDKIKGLMAGGYGKTVKQFEVSLD